MYIPTMAVTEFGFRFFKKAATYQEFGFKNGEIMLKRRLDYFQNPATAADLRNDFWKFRQRKCTEINAFTPQMIFVHPRSPGFETQGNESKCRGFFKSSISSAKSSSHMGRVQAQ